MPGKAEFLVPEEAGGSTKVSFHCNQFFPDLELYWPCLLNPLRPEQLHFWYPDSTRAPLQEQLLELALLDASMMGGPKFALPLLLIS